MRNQFTTTTTFQFNDLYIKQHNAITSWGHHRIEEPLSF